MRAQARRLTPMFGFSLLGTVLIGASFLAALGVVKPPGSHPAGPTRAALSSGSVNAAAQVGNRFAVGGTKAVNLPAATSAPVAAPAALVSAPPIAARENFGFAPYWTLPQSATFSLTGLSTLAYFSVGVNPNGTLEESGPGWNGYESQALADLITRAHGAGERVVLTVNDFGQSSLDALTSSPTAAATLAAALTPVLQAKSLDGVNFDFEGEGSGDQAGLTNLITSVSGALRAADPHWQITMDTYASSAGDPGGFYNIPALAPAVDAFFVMAYELNLQGAATAASPLTSGMFSDLTAVQQYAAVVPAAKVILGTPFFGIDWPTANGTLQATPTGAAADIADAQVPSTAPLYWDPVTGTGWTSYQVGPQWHESFFETPYGLYLVAQLAAHYGLRGVGIWALGMESNGPQMIAALDGLAPAGSPGGTGPTATSTSPTTPVATASGPAASPTTTGPGSTTTSAPGAPAAPGATSTTKPAGATTTTTTAGPVITGAFHGTLHTLKPVGPGSVDKGLALGSMISFSTTDPAYSCLNGKALPVYPYGTLSGYDVAVAAAPGDCITQEFIFPG